MRWWTLPALMGWVAVCADGAARATEENAAADSAMLAGSDIVKEIDAGTLGAQLVKLAPGDGAVNDWFGSSVAISNGVAIVQSKGSAYLFDVRTGAELAKLTPDGGEAGDRFSRSVAISDDVAIVGAEGDGAYLFDVITGGQLARLTRDDGESQDWFVSSVAISDGVAIVGTEDHAAYLFDVMTGDQFAKLTPDDGESQDWFGCSVAISDGVAIVGAHGDDDHREHSGSAYLFDVMTGGQLAKLTPDDGEADDRFGYSVAISNGVAIVGARGDDDHGENSGSAYLFNARTGAQLAKLIPGDGEAGDGFGYSVAISDGVAIIGGPWNNNHGEHSGLAYLFDVMTGAQLAKLTPDDGEGGDRFGRSVAISDGAAIVGTAPIGENSGSAYLFDVQAGD